MTQERLDELTLQLAQRAKGDFISSPLTNAELQEILRELSEAKRAAVDYKRQRDKFSGFIERQHGLGMLAKVALGETTE